MWGTVPARAPARIRVLHVLNTLSTGGAETLVLNLAQAHDRARFDLLVASLQTDGEIGQRLRGAGIPTFVLARRTGFDPTLAGKVLALCRREAIDVVHTHNVAPWLYAGPAARLAGAALLHTEHSNLFAGQRALRRAERALALLTRAVICDGDSVRRQLIEAQGLPVRKVITIHNGIDTGAFAIQPSADDRAAQRRGLGIGADDLVIACVARLESVKDHATLLRALAVVAVAKPRVRLLLVGDGTQRAALQRQAAGLSPNVIFAGRRDDVAALLPLCDLFALASTSEGLPLTILEAMAAGLPCVATDVGAVGEAVRDGETGRLVPAGDEATLAAALLDLLRDPGLRRRLGAEGQRRAQAQFDLRMMVRRYQDLWGA
jgi:glycosyltransferase involved in cell wall biosynthesis